jgi:hypothetical protein
MGGYYKNLPFITHDTVNDRLDWADLNRLRLEWDAKWGKYLSFKLDWDNEIIAGSYVSSPDFDQQQLFSNQPYIDLDWQIARTSNFFYGQGFYRAWAKFEKGPAVFILGRQEIIWGVMDIFSPVDLFTRLPLFDIEQDETEGLTAANLTYNLTDSLKINPVASFYPELSNCRFAARLTQTVGTFNLSGLGGRFLQDDIGGFDFDGQLWKFLGLKGEFIYDVAYNNDNFAQVSGGIYHNFGSSLYFSLEYFFNGQANGQPTDSPSFANTADQIKTIHKNFVSLQTKYDFLPTWNFFMQTIVDVNGGSIYLNPEVSWMAYPWWKLKVGTQFSDGEAGGDFVSVNDVYYLQTQFFF